MKKLVLISAVLSTPFAMAYSSMEAARDARKQMEKQTETQILEKLEASRLQDEQNRRQKFESLNFSVVQDPAAAPTTVAPVETATF